MQSNWSPTARLIAGAGGSAIVVGAMRRRTIPAMAMGAAGFGLLTRALTNLELRRLVGVDGPRGIDIQKAINVDAQPEAVFDFWTNFERYPQFMSHVREVRQIAEGRYHWVVDGPAGSTVQWDAEITRQVPNELLEWRSLPGSPIRQIGVVRFDRNPDGGTRIGIRMSYNPPAGAIGHALAVVFRSDPKREMDDDLVRLKSLIERGKTTANGESVTREDVDAPSTSTPPSRAETWEIRGPDDVAADESL